MIKVQVKNNILLLARNYTCPWYANDEDYGE